jgi:hypothetical protein
MDAAFAIPSTSTPAALPAPVSTSRGINVRTEKQPPGREGTAFSMMNVARLTKESHTHPEVVAFARRACRDGKYPETVIGRARAIWDAMRKQNIRWLPDPIRGEFMARANHFLPSEPGKDDAFLVAGDCDELTCLYLALFLAAVQSVGVESAAVLGHSYSPSQQLSHVLAAVYDGKQWIRVDPSGDWEFGQFKHPTWETMISVPSCKVICNAALCASGPRAARPAPAPIDDMKFVALEGLPRDSAAVVDAISRTNEAGGDGDSVLNGLEPGSMGALMDTMLLADDFFSLGTVGKVNPPCSTRAMTWAMMRDGTLGFGEPTAADRAEAEATAQIMRMDAQNVTDAKDSAMIAHGEMLKTFEDLKVDPYNNPFGWNAQIEETLAATVEAADMFVAAVNDALAGIRRVSFDRNDGYTIELLPGDKTKLVSDGKNIFIASALTAGNNPAAAPEAIAVPASSNLNAVQAEVAVAIVAVLLGIFVAAGVGYGLYASLDALKTIAVQAKEKAWNDRAYECAQNKEAEACALITKALGEAQAKAKEPDAEIAGHKASEAWAETAKVGLIVVGTGLLLGGGAVVLHRKGLL